MNLKPLLNTYIRGLAERESDGDAPQRLQDLGTLVDWLLRHQGYRVLRRVYRYQGTERLKLSGFAEEGVDIIAEKEDKTFLFVLKHGDVTHWPGNEGSLVYDLYNVHRKRIAQHGGNDQQPVVVVAVHNGDVMRDRVGNQIDDWMERTEKDFGARPQWWDADRLVEMTAAVLEENFNDASADFFPPQSQILLRLAFDSLAREPHGARFDDRAIDQWLDLRLPSSAPPQKLQLERALRELALVAGMLAEACRLSEARHALPVLDTVRKMLCRALAVGANAQLLQPLLEQYLGAAEQLGNEIRPALGSSVGLALGAPSEAVDYPLRCFRIAGHLAGAGLVAMDLDRSITQRELISSTVEQLLGQVGGLTTPLTDDQVIELLAIATFLFRHGVAHSAPSQFIEALFRRLMARSRRTPKARIPLPATWILARQPLPPEDLDRLIRAVIFGDDQVYETGGSLLLPAVFLMAQQVGLAMTDDDVHHFAPQKKKEPDDTVASFQAVYFQAWLPGTTVWEGWYKETLWAHGTTRVLNTQSLVHLMDEIKNLPNLDPSPAQKIGLPALDWLAALLWRNPPPLGWVRSQWPSPDPADGVASLGDPT